jgi:hypothetical protein
MRYERSNSLFVASIFAFTPNTVSAVGKILQRLRRFLEDFFDPLDHV